MIKHIWEGVYRSFQEAPVSGKGHSGDAWEANSRSKICGLLDSVQRRASNPPVPRYDSSLLPVLAAIFSERADQVTILDFGGGPGVTYVQVAAGMGHSTTLDYHVVDTEAISRVGKQVFHDDPRIHFHESLPDSLEAVDIVHLGSSLHYIDDWKGLIKQLSAYEPRYFMYTDLPAGDFPSFVTVQNYYGSKIPARFFNVGEVREEMAANGFSLLFRSAFVGTYFGKAQEMPQNNFPEDLRVGDTCSLVFRREPTSAR